MPNLNLNEFMRAIIHIRDQIDKVETKGHTNRELLVSAYNDCNTVLRQLGNILDEVQKLQNSQLETTTLQEVQLDETD